MNPTSSKSETQSDALRSTGPDAEVEAVVDAAIRRVAPLWSLDAFVAVNPWFGLAEMTADEAALRMARVSGARATMPRAWYLKAIEEGRIADRHLDRAIASIQDAAHRRAEILPQLPENAAELRSRLGSGVATEAEAPRVPTVADAAAAATGTAWGEFVVERVSAWASAHFDEGQSDWASPWRHLDAWTAWREEMSLDRTAEAAGVSGARATVASLHSDAEVARAALLDELGVAPEDRELYLHRLLTRVGGWSAWMRRRLWDAELHDGTDRAAADFMTILLAWEVILLRGFPATDAATEWTRLRDCIGADGRLEACEAELRIDLALQQAFELAEQERMVGTFEAAARSASSPAGSAAEDTRPDAQAAFCIDVRSEVYRRALESVAPGVETIGFAGFFGAAVEYVGVGEDGGHALCPVLLTPAARIRESVAGDEDATEAAGTYRALRRRASGAWKSFKMGAVSCFGFVGPVGLAYLGRLVADGFGWTRPTPRPGTDALRSEDRAKLGPDLTPRTIGGVDFGMTPEARLATAEFILNGMSLTDGFAPIVLLAGHGSTTTNNPHATGLDCGACGGQSGEANAMVATALLNDADVRRGLAERGIPVPADTLFVPALHDTCTDDVTCIVPAEATATQRERIAELQGWLEEASRLTRAERAPALGLSEASAIDDAIRGRARDWSQVRPEWGLAGCSAFVAAPRRRTAGIDLGGRSFLHSYDWRQDDGFGVLELILTAPVVVASWISLQYYGSTVDNTVYGSGNKTLHNVVGTLGVLEGNGGDLRVGLPMQSVHDGTEVAHEPMRLNVIVEAPIEAMNEVIERHEHLRHLVDHGWIHLWAMDDTGALRCRYAGDLRWARVRRGAGTRLAETREEEAA
jgi:uncharacterized protein YbcC (UPF0753/DUF2309 family)